MTRAGVLSVRALSVSTQTRFKFEPKNESAADKKTNVCPFAFARWAMIFVPNERGRTICIMGRSWPYPTHLARVPWVQLGVVC